MAERRVYLFVRPAFRSRRMPGKLWMLKKALDIVGSRTALCSALWVGDEELKAYLEGKKPIPDALYQAAADIVSGKKPTRKK